MAAKISPKDYEALSAYLDDELSEKERKSLLIRLQESGELRATLEELRKTRLLLRTQPRRSAPRSFVLKPEMVAAQESKPGFWNLVPALRLSSALSALLLIVVFIGDLLTSRPMLASAPAEPAPAIMQASPADALSTEAMMEAEAMQPMEKAVPTQMLPWRTPVEKPMTPLEEGGMGGGEGREQQPPPAAPVEALPLPDSTLAPYAQPPQPTLEPIPAEELSVSQGPYPEAARTENLMPSPLSTPSVEVAMQPAVEAPQATRAAQPLTGYFLQPEADWQGMSPVRWLEVILALLAVGTGMAYFILRRTGG